jgi:hypothetical protein
MGTIQERDGLCGGVKCRLQPGAHAHFRQAEFWVGLLDM